MAKNEKGLSPVIATVLLIAMVVVIGLIIFLWFRGFQGDAVTKFGGQNAEMICPDIEFDASYSNEVLTLSNNGNVPIYQIRAKISSDDGRTQESIDLHEISEADWPDVGLREGSVLSPNIGNKFSDGEEALLIPILRGKAGSGEKTYVCDEQYGVLIDL